MPSSTSNSNTRAPALRYGLLWFGVLTLVALSLFGSEYHWQKKGFKPHIVDTKLFWCMHRSDVYTQNGRKKIVVVGTSRAQLGIDPEALETVFPQFDVVHLAIDGALPFEVIKDLCDDPNFDGLILADVTVPFLCITEEAVTKTEREYTSFYHTEFQKASSIEKQANTFLGTWLQSQFVIFSPVLAFKSLLYDRLNPKQLYFHMDANRFRPAYYYDRLSPDERKEHRQKRIERITQNGVERLAIEKYQQHAQQELAILYNKLKERGGNMVFVRMPTTDQHWEIDQQMAPKAQYWDKLEQWSSIPSIHFLDHATLANFDCPDTSHLDAQDAPNFTRELAHIVGQKLHLQNN